MPKRTAGAESFLWRLILAASVLGAQAVAGDFRLPRHVQQCVLGISESWDSSHAILTLHERRGGHWRQVEGPWPARLGKHGLAWGLGMHPNPADGKLKREGDGRAPAGVFLIGGAWGYAADVERRPGWPYSQVTSRDLWVEDAASPLYNRHVRLSREPTTPWEKKQRMKQNDPAHALKVFIAHNASEKPAPGAGSSIFFHIWRAGGQKPSSGCTVLAEHPLRKLVAWLDPAASPVFVLLPKADYLRLRKAWNLP